MPRPNLKLIGVGHHRTPVVAIRRDVSFDTRLISTAAQAWKPLCLTAPTTNMMRKEQQPASLRKIADMFTLLEETLLSDSRTWMLGTPRPSLADFKATPGALSAAQFSAKACPQVHAWINRFCAALDEAKTRKRSELRTLSGEQAAAESRGRRCWGSQGRRRDGWADGFG
ncbi:hypothetical protein MY11210_000508 [Beauveria gryllotalpidicola]